MVSPTLVKQGDKPEYFSHNSKTVLNNKASNTKQSGFWRYLFFPRKSDNSAGKNTSCDEKDNTKKVNNKQISTQTHSKDRHRRKAPVIHNISMCGNTREMKNIHSFPGNVVIPLQKKGCGLQFYFCVDKKKNKNTLKSAKKNKKTEIIETVMNPRPLAMSTENNEICDKFHKVSIHSNKVEHSQINLSFACPNILKDKEKTQESSNLCEPGVLSTSVTIEVPVPDVPDLGVENIATDPSSKCNNYFNLLKNDFAHEIKAENATDKVSEKGVHSIIKKYNDFLEVNNCNKTINNRKGENERGYETLGIQQDKGNKSDSLCDNILSRDGQLDGTLPSKESKERLAEGHKVKINKSVGFIDKLKDVILTEGSMRNEELKEKENIIEKENNNNSKCIEEQDKQKQFDNNVALILQKLNTIECKIAQLEKNNTDPSIGKIKKMRNEAGKPAGLGISPSKKKSSISIKFNQLKNKNTNHSAFVTIIPSGEKVNKCIEIKSQTERIYINPLNEITITKKRNLLNRTKHTMHDSFISFTKQNNSPESQKNVMLSKCSSQELLSCEEAGSDSYISWKKISEELKMSQPTISYFSLTSCKTCTR